MRNIKGINGEYPLVPFLIPRFQKKVWDSKVCQKVYILAKLCIDNNIINYSDFPL